jgi:uncharacterized protein YidB (DUF937 family)
MSPIMMALLGLLAYKALKGSGASGVPSGARLPSGAGASGGLGDILGGLLGGRAGSGLPNRAPAGTDPGGGLDDLIRGGLGGLLGGAAAGSVLTGGLGNLVKDLEQSGHGRAAQSWVGRGPNDAIAPDDLANALGGDTLDALTRQTGLGRTDLLAGLSQNLPDFVDQLTPNGRLPTDDEASQMV